MVLYGQRACGAGSAPRDLLGRVRIDLMKILPLHQIAHLLVMKALGGAITGNAYSVLSAAPGSQYFLSRVFHLELIAHGGRIRLRDQILRRVHEIGWAHDHGTLTIDHILHILAGDALILLAGGAGSARVRGRCRVIVAAQLVSALRRCRRDGFDGLLRVFETLEVREVLYLLGLGGLATCVDSDVVGLKLHEWRCVAWGLERSHHVLLHVQLRVCLLLAVHCKSGCR